jgi:uroporphyrin-III C-methyltransferase/precorrin-2 dehydrogenase/sirohydrochlorin ferrochelatase
VPGITAAQGAAATLATPLTGRGRTRRLQYVTGHSRDGALPELDWNSIADASTTTAVYMPTRTLEALVSNALAAGLDAATPAIAISRATRADQQVIRGAIGELPRRMSESSLPGPVLVMIGVAAESAASAATEPATAAAP